VSEAADWIRSAVDAVAAGAHIVLEIVALPFFIASTALLTAGLLVLALIVGAVSGGDPSGSEPFEVWSSNPSDCAGSRPAVTIRFDNGYLMPDAAYSCVAADSECAAVPVGAILPEACRDVHLEIPAWEVLAKSERAVTCPNPERTTSLAFEYRGAISYTMSMCVAATSECGAVSVGDLLPESCRPQ